MADSMMYPALAQSSYFDMNLKMNMTLVGSSNYFNIKTSGNAWSATRIDIYKSAPIAVSSPYALPSTPSYENPYFTTPYVVPTASETYETTIQTDPITRKTVQKDRLASRIPVSNEHLISMGAPDRPGQKTPGQALRRYYQDQWEDRWKQGTNWK